MKSVPYVMTQIRVHDHNVVAARRLHSVHVRSAQTEFGGARTQNQHIVAVDGLQLLGHVQRAVRTAVVDDDDLER